MFIDDVEFGEYPEIAKARLPRGRIGAWIVRSNIRLQFLDKCERRRVNKRCEPTGSIQERLFIQTDGKASFFGPTAIDTLAIQNHQSANEVVQSRTEIVSNIPDDCRPSRIDFPYFPDYKIKALPFKIRIDGNKIRFFFRAVEGVDSNAEIIDLCINNAIY
jgi:hypothetical protein